VSVVSSIYLLVVHDNLNLSIMMINVNGPSHDQWDMHPFKTSHSDR